MSKFFYPYAETDLLKNPQKYQMTPYHGSKFLVSYFEFRNQILKKIPTDSSLDINKQLPTEQLELVTDLNKDFETSPLLSQILKNLLEGNLDSKMMLFINTLIRKFEIRKKEVKQRKDFPL